MGNDLKALDWGCLEGATNQTKGDVLDRFQLRDVVPERSVISEPEGGSIGDDREDACLV